MHKNQGQIEAVIHEAYRDVPPAQKAARILFTKSVKESDLTEVLKHTVLDHVKVCAVRNELRDLWKGIKT